MRKNIVKTTTITETHVHLDTLRAALKLPKWGLLELVDRDGKTVPCVISWSGDKGPRVLIRNRRETTR